MVGEIWIIANRTFFFNIVFDCVLMWWWCTDVCVCVDVYVHIWFVCLVLPDYEKLNGTAVLLSVAMYLYVGCTFPRWFFFSHQLIYISLIRAHQTPFYILLIFTFAFDLFWSREFFFCLFIFFKFFFFHFSTSWWSFNKVKNYFSSSRLFIWYEWLCLYVLDTTTWSNFRSVIWHFCFVFIRETH